MQNEKHFPTLLIHGRQRVGQVALPLDFNPIFFYYVFSKKCRFRSFEKEK